MTLPRNDFDDDRLTTADVQQLLAGLASDDACVREMAVRLIGTQRAEAVGAELVSRLSATDANLRAVAALGLGLVESQSALDP